MGTSFKFPEVRVERRGVTIERVIWDPIQDGDTQFDLTGMRILSVQREVKHGELPITKISVVARLVEVESNTGIEPK